MLQLQNDVCKISITNDSNYSSEQTGAYDRAYHFGDSTYIVSQHAIVCRSSEGVVYSCVLLGDGGMSAVHAHSAILFENLCLVAVGRHLIALRLPKLDLVWSTEVDTATCFGIYYSTRHACFIPHGECEIASVSKSGNIIWWCNGKDIFTNGFALREDIIEVIDFNDEVYAIEIATGMSTLVTNSSNIKIPSRGWFDQVKQWVRQ